MNVRWRDRDYFMESARVQTGFHIIARIAPIAPIAPIARNSGQAIQAIHCFHLIAPIACEVGGTGHVLDPSLIFSRQMESKMAARNRRARIVAFYLLLLTILRRRRTREAPDARKHRFWVREMYQKRQQLGVFHTLARELRLHDRKYPFR